MQRLQKVDETSENVLEVPIVEPNPLSKFVIPPEYLNSLEGLLEQHMKRPNSPFKILTPISYKDLTPGLIESEVINKGMPVVVSGVCKNWNKDLFSCDWLEEHFGDWEMINSPRDLQAMVDLGGWTLRDYIDYVMQEPSTRKKSLYGKDITCPEQWKNYLAHQLNSYFCYEQRDLVCHLAKEQQPETLMVYIGIDNTYTPAHTDICGSIGHNLMVFADDDAYALWFITETQYKSKASALFGKYGASLEHDNCFLAVEKLAEADFPFYIIKQKKGDFIVVPPDSAHQVLNKGGKTIKVAWNRITASTIVNTYYSVLPFYHEICKAEVYRVKSLVYYGLKNRLKLINEGRYEERYLTELPPLIRLFEEIVYDEWVPEDVLNERSEDIEKVKFDDRVPHLRTCNFCNLDIFNRCYRCPVCTDDYDICLACIAEGRGCKHNPELVLMEHISVNKLKDDLKLATEAFQTLCRHFHVPNSESKLPKYKFEEEHHSLASLAFQMVCRYKDGSEYRCHQCKRRKKQHFMVDCTQTCGKAYCAMCLWNRYGIKQIYAQRNKSWECPYCNKNCNCAACLRKRGVDPKEHEVLAAYKALLEISVVIPPAFAKNSDSVAGVCDSAPKPAKSQGYSVAEMELAKTSRVKIDLVPSRVAPKDEGKYKRDPYGKGSYDESHALGFPSEESDEDIYEEGEPEPKQPSAKKRAKPAAIKTSPSLTKIEPKINVHRGTQSFSTKSKKPMNDADSETDDFEQANYDSEDDYKSASKRRKRSKSDEAPVKPVINKVVTIPKELAKNNSNKREKPISHPVEMQLPSSKKILQPATIQRSDHYIPNDYLPMDYESSVLTFSHPGITYDEYIRVYNLRAKRERKVLKDAENKLYTYWCFCGLIRNSSQFFASHAKVCPVYKACVAEARSADDPIFQATTGAEPQLLSDSEDSEEEREAFHIGVTVRLDDDFIDPDSLNMFDPLENESFS